MSAASLNSAVERLRREAEQAESLSIFEILSIFESLGPSVAAILLALPFLQPLPLIGLSTPLGLTIALSGLAIALDRPIWLPSRFSRTLISSAIILKKLAVLEGLTAKLGGFFQHSDEPPQPLTNSTRRWLGVNIIVHGLLLALPLPVPFSNTVPAWTCGAAAMTVIFPSAKGLWLTNGLILVNFIFWSAVVGAATLAIPTLVETWQ